MYTDDLFTTHASQEAAALRNQLAVALAALEEITSASEAERTAREVHFAGPKPNEKAWREARKHHATTIAKARQVLWDNRVTP
jgi:hypothetical protein